MRVCTCVSTGKLIEMQSGDDGGLDVLRDNAANAGYVKEDIEVRVVSDEEAQKLLTAQMRLERTANPAKTLAEQIIADPLDLAKLKQALQ